MRLRCGGFNVAPSVPGRMAYRPRPAVRKRPLDERAVRILRQAGVPEAEIAESVRARKAGA